MKNGEKSAMPIIATEQSLFNQEPAPAQSGLTKREYFAGLAMQGLSSIDWNITKEPIEETLAKMVAWQAVKIADAILAELEKPQP